MDFWIPLAIAAIIIFPLGIYSALSSQNKHIASTNGIINCDPNKNKFIYKVDLTRDEIIAILLTPCAKDTLTCTFDYDMSKITFSDFMNSETYYLVTEKCNGFTILRLERKYLHNKYSDIKNKINPFIMSKLEAEVEAIPFSEYDR